MLLDVLKEFKFTPEESKKIEQMREIELSSLTMKGLKENRDRQEETDKRYIEAGLLPPIRLKSQRLPELPIKRDKDLLEILSGIVQKGMVKREQ